MDQEDELKVYTDFDSFDVFPWNVNFETGYSKIDEQHQTLVSLLNKLARTLIGDEFIEVNSAFEELSNYASFHFDAEEAVWLEYFADDPWLSVHQETHAAFLPRAIELRERDAGKPLTYIVENIIKFLIRWLAFHIIDNDKRMAIAVEAMKSGSSIDEAKAISERNMSGSMRVLIEAILDMYDGLSSMAIDLMRERRARIKAEEELKEANKKLEELSITDQLTDIYNRRYFDQIFQMEIRRAIRAKTTLTFIMMDIDYFKHYNDNYGHQKGDIVLKKVAAKFRECCRRPSDYVFRIGGEEFGVLATDMTDKNAYQFAEILRSAIEGMKITHAYNKVSEYVTVSVGLVNKIPTRDDRIEDYTRVADARLYQAKASGRNRVVDSD